LTTIKHWILNYFSFPDFLIFFEPSVFLPFLSLSPSDISDLETPSPLLVSSIGT
jgi:hypothetical protein